MDFDEYQQKALSTAIYPKTKIVYRDGREVDAPYVYAMLGSVGELGETFEAVKKMIRDSGGILTPEIRSKVVKEVGDAFWYLAVMVWELGHIPLSEVAETNIAKLSDRMKRGVVQGSGDDR